MDQRLQGPAVAAPPDWRGLCEELTEHLSLLDEPPHELVCRAQEALAQPEPEVVGPTDEELWQVGDEDFRANTWPMDAIRYARAVLSRWGHQPAPPAGELLKEAAWLRNECSAENADGNWISMSIDQALDLVSLLERQAAPVPVAVSERLPQPEDCDAEGRCWFWRTDGADEFWELVVPLSNIHVFNLTAQWKYTHWLPAHALPLPSGEVE